MSHPNKRALCLLMLAVLLGLSARVPGVFWGWNFPFGWYGHHVDEYTHLVNAETMINPTLPPRWQPHPYPKGLAAHVAVPMVATRILTGAAYDPLPSPKAIMVWGRVVSVAYGAATIAVLLFIARLLFRDPRIPVVSAFILALGGLHVTQGHFFVSDVPSMFWFMLGQYLLFLELKTNVDRSSLFLTLASLCFGISFGLKLAVFALPSLAIVCLVRPPRPFRVMQTSVFFLFGIVAVNFSFFTPFDLFKTVARGVGDPYQFSWLASSLLYAIELPSIVSFPVLILSSMGTVFLSKRYLAAQPTERFVAISLVVTAPLLINVLFILFKLDHFPRHLVPLIPWMSIAAAWSLVRIGDVVHRRGFQPAILVYAPFFLYLAAFVYDGERVFIQEPRNEAARWISRNVPRNEELWWQGHEWIEGYNHVGFPEMGRPSVVVIEMHHANHYLSGMWFKNDFPRDYRRIFDSSSQERVDALQSLFMGTSDYEEKARFGEAYVMPDYLFSDSLIGNRSRNYVAEIVIFRKKGG